MFRVRSPFLRAVSARRSVRAISADALRRDEAYSVNPGLRNGPQNARTDCARWTPERRNDKRSPYRCPITVLKALSLYVIFIFSRAFAM